MTKTQLMEYRIIDREMRQIEEIMARLRSRIEGPRMTVYTGVPGMRGCCSDCLEHCIDRLKELFTKYNVLWDNLIDAQQRIEDFIKDLPCELRTLARMRCIQGLKWDEVAEHMDYSERHCRRLFDDVLAICDDDSCPTLSVSNVI